LTGAWGFGTMLPRENRGFSATGVAVWRPFAGSSTLRWKVESGSFARRAVPRWSEAILQHARFVCVGKRVN
jgi:hypothetical protein